MSKGKGRGAEVIELPDSDATTFTLKTPIMVDGEKVVTLTLRDPELRQLKGIKIPTGGQDFDLGEMPRMVGVVANIPTSSAEQIRVSDLMELFGAVMDFFGVAEDSGSSKKS